MDWYVYGGVETGNTNIQSGLFNRMIPRPLNRYVGNNLQIFRCPVDTDPLEWTDGVSQFSGSATAQLQRRRLSAKTLAAAAVFRH